MLDPGAQAFADVERLPLGERQDLLRAVADGGAVGQPPDDQAGQRGRQRAQVRDRRRVAGLGQHGLDRGVEHGGLVAQQLDRAQHVGLRRRVQLAQRRDQPVARAVARERAATRCVGSSRHVEAVLGAPRLRVGAPGAEQRAHEPALARAHAQQRAPARRGGEPVEHGLDLVGGGVAGGDVGVALLGEPRRLGVADVARPRLQVALGPARAVDGERHAEALAQRGAVRRVGRRGVAQAVVDVQRARRRRRSAPRGRAGRSSRPRRRAARRPARPAAAGPPPRTARLEAHDGSACVARNSSVDSEKPLSLTSPMRSNSRWSPAASTSGRVTSTSPPAARAPTRAARLTARP